MKRFENGAKARDRKKVMLHFKVILCSRDTENSLLGQ